jgi:hypothetical protein
MSTRKSDLSKKVLQRQDTFSLTTQSDLDTNKAFVHCDRDTVAKWFHQGFDRILENIFISLPLKLLIACKMASKDWQKIVLHIHRHSRKTRLMKLQDIRIHEEWLMAKPRVRSVPFNELRPSVIDLVADEKNIILALVGPRQDIKKSEILILDSVNMTTIRILNVEERVTALDIAAPGNSWSASMRLDLNEKYLVAALVFRTTYAILIWDREHDFSENPLALKRKTILGGKLDPYGLQAHRSLFLKPVISDDFVYLPICFNENQSTYEIVYSCWNMSDGTFTDLIRKELSVPLIGYNFLRICLSVKTSHILVFKSCGDDEAFLFALNEREPIWTIGDLGCVPQLCGIDENYVVISEPDSVVKVFSLKDGSLEMSFNVENLFDCSAYESQIKCGRIALMGFLKECGHTDVVVFDLKTGQKLFSCRNDLQLNVGGNFVLERDQLLLWSNFNEDNLLSLKFWI